MIDVFWKIANKFYHKGYKRIARLFELLSMAISSHAVSAQIDIGENSAFYHHGLGTTVLEHTMIGNNTIIFQNVTIGKKRFDDKWGGQIESQLEIIQL